MWYYKIVGCYYSVLLGHLHLVLELRHPSEG